jgi:hypothetical protein
LKKFSQEQFNSRKDQALWVVVLKEIEPLVNGGEAT